MASYGEVIQVDDGNIDLGAVSDESLVGLFEDIAQRLTAPYGIAYERQVDQESLEKIEWELDYRLRHNESLKDDLEGYWSCALGCC